MPDNGRVYILRDLNTGRPVRMTEAQLQQARESTAFWRDVHASWAADERKQRDTATARRAAADDAEIQSGRTNVDVPPPMPAAAGPSGSAAAGGSIAGAVRAFQARL